MALEGRNEGRDSTGKTGSGDREMYWTGILAKRAEKKESKHRLVDWAQQDRLCWDTGSNRGVTRKMLGRLEKGDWGEYTMQLRRGKKSPGKIGGRWSSKQQ